MDYRNLLIQGGRALDPPEDHALLAQQAGRMQLTPYVAKASYVIRVLRQMVASAGLSFAANYHLGALYMAFDATELVGRCVGGFRQDRTGATKRLKTGLQYLEKIDPTPRSMPHTINDYIEIRHFVGHGAASAEAGVTIEFGPQTSIALMFLLTEALNRMWTDDAAMDEFARCEIQPLLSTTTTGSREAIFVRDAQAMLAGGTMPGDNIPHDDWRNIPRVVNISTASPPTTGF